MRTYWLLGEKTDVYVIWVLLMEGSTGPKPLQHEPCFSLWILLLVWRMHKPAPSSHGTGYSENLLRNYNVGMIHTCSNCKRNCKGFVFFVFFMMMQLPVSIAEDFFPQWFYLFLCFLYLDLYVIWKPMCISIQHMKRAKVQCTELASEVIFRPGTIHFNICIYVYPRQCKIFCSINNLKIYNAVFIFWVHRVCEVNCVPQYSLWVIWLS